MAPRSAPPTTSSFPHPSLSRPPAPSRAYPPRLVHSLRQCENSVLSLLADEHHIYSGSQCDEITVWDKVLYKPKTTLKGHTASVLSLELAPERKWLFSASGDSTVRIWSTVSLTCLYVLNPYLDTDAGDLFSLAWSPTLQTVFFGCQNTSVQWFDCNGLGPTLAPSAVSESPSGTSTPSLVSENGKPRLGLKKVHKFFDSYPQYARRAADEFAVNSSLERLSIGSDDCVGAPLGPAPLAIIDLQAENSIDSAHYGYVYCMALLPSTREGAVDPVPASGEVHLATGSGDETVKLWKYDDWRLSPVHTFACGRGAVLSLVTRGDTIFAGCQDGYVTVWDLETKTLVRSIIVQENIAILSLSLLHSDLYTCSADGQLQRWSSSFNCTASWTGHDGIVLSSIITRSAEVGDFQLITGANDDHIKIWQVEPPVPTGKERALIGDIDDLACSISRNMNDTMVYALSKFVSIPSVSAIPAHREDCRQAAIWLKKCLTQLGAESTLLPTGNETSPLVLATFRGAQTDRPKPRILFYGHYDVTPAPPDEWLSDPFNLTGRNGYLYGRGVTDNKGPILAAACAAAELLGSRALNLDLVFLIEGEEEAGSGGFEAAVEKYHDLIAPIDAILVSNSTWISEDIPCITYGLRGVLHCSLEVKGNAPDLHSGVEGGAVVEPMLDVVKLLSKLVDDDRRVLIPSFYDDVRPFTDVDKQLYQVLSTVTQRPASSLSSRWREPSLTIHKIEVSGPNSSTVIPAKVTAQLSIRVVPDQRLDVIASSLCTHLKSSFKSLQSPNTFSVNVNHTADWWLGNLEDRWFKALEDALHKEWGVEPLRIREGGSIPSIPFLEKHFMCPALHLPLGQSSDQAHLPNERMSLTNLRHGKSVIERFLISVADIVILSSV